MAWMIFQSLIVFAVVCANIYLQVTPNGVLASLAGIGVALVATAILSGAMDRLRRARRLR